MFVDSHRFLDNQVLSGSLMAETGGRGVIVGGWGVWGSVTWAWWGEEEAEIPTHTWKVYWAKKKCKISLACGRAPVMPATQEAEAGELLEPRRQRLR